MKPQGAFRLFANYRLFAVIGAVVLFGGYAVSAASGGAVGLHGGTTSHGASVRGEGVIRTEPEPANVPPRIVQARQYPAPPAANIDHARTHTATLHTTRGDIVVELLPDEAPLAVNNFIFLTRDGFFDGVMFHRVIPGFVAQAGDPTGTGSGGPGYHLPFETTDAPFEAGMLAMARPSEAGAPNNGSQFFFALGRQPTLDGRSTAFGRVIAGMEVLTALTARDLQQEVNPPPGDRITTIEIIEE